MANIQILELAKDLKVDVAVLQEAATQCGVAASDPSALLNSGDREKVEAAIKHTSTTSHKLGKKTLTLGRPAVKKTGSTSTESGSQKKVQVRRRRHHIPVGVTPPPLPEKKAPEPVAKAKVITESHKQQSPPKPAVASAPQEKKDSSQPSGNRPKRNNKQGPRTTIRKTLTPAQIAASKAPRSSLKQIEARIKDERSQRRGNTAGGKKPTTGTTRPAATAAGGTRRAPSVAVAPTFGFTPGAGGAKRKPGSGQRFQKRRLTPAEKAARHDYAAKRHEVLTEEQEERMARLARGGRKKGDSITKDDDTFVVRDVEIPQNILVGELANRMAVKSAEVVKALFNLGMAVTINESVDSDTAVLIVEEFGHTPKLLNEAAVEDVLIDAAVEDEEGLIPRPPVVVVMGHVDHGKTSILDALRKARVAEGEAGGITQHIGAYMVKLEAGGRVVFVDTPGHEAFTSLRARGAKLTDVAVLVVAADDGVKPQTVEALNHARAAGVPIIVAVNKIDKEGADPEMVKRQLAEHELLAEDWGGDAIFVPVSAVTGAGLDDLLEMLALQTEILELKANPDLRGRGVVIESRLDRGRGPVATVLVQSGTFKKGDIVVVGSVMGRIRAIVDENSVQHRTAGPSIPFELLGLEEVPESGLDIIVVESERQARDILSYRKDQLRQQGISEDKKLNLDELFANIQNKGAQEVPVLIKGDVSGSVDALAESMSKVGTDEVCVKVIHKGIGGITESDVMLAAASNAIVIGFNVRPETKAKQMAAREGVDIRFYKVIYDAIDEIKDAMTGKLAPTEVEKVIGSAEVREVFQVPKLGAVAGCFVTDGYVVRDAHVRLLRDAVLVYDGKLASLRRFKDNVKEVKNGYECGIGMENFNDIKASDNMEFYIIEEIAASL